jgi:hypothetical protein
MNIERYYYKKIQYQNNINKIMINGNGILFKIFFNFLILINLNLVIIKDIEKIKCINIYLDSFHLPEDLSIN